MTHQDMTTPSNPVLSAFGLEDQEAPLCRAFRATGAAIHGGAAVSWYLKTDPPPTQDIDIWCQPAEPILKPILYALYDTIFRAAGYAPSLTSSSRQKAYAYSMRDAHIDKIHDWYHRILGRKIQLIFRESRAKDGTPVSASPTGEFDIDITTVRVGPSPDADCLSVYLPSPELGAQIDRRVLNIHNLKGQNLRKVQDRIRKYYSRGFAFESTEARCACACGTTHHMVVTPPHRLSLKEAFAHVRTSWIAANPLSRWDPHRADNVKARFLASFTEKFFLSQTVKELSDSLDVCDRAMALPQNSALFPADTRWVSDFHDILFLLWQFRTLEALDAQLDEKEDSAASSCNRIIRRAKRLLEQSAIETFPEIAVKVRAMQRRAIAVWTAQSKKKVVPALTIIETVDTISYS